MQRTLRDVAIVLAVSTVVFFTNLGGPRLWDRDEPRNAGCAAEMLAANDWVTPVFNAELRTHKPVLTYWFMMLSYSIFGVTEFAARFPSAVYGIGTSLLTYSIGRRLFGATAGVWAAIALATSIMFCVASRAATPDAPLIFFSTLALAFYVWGTTERGSQNQSAEPGFVRLFPVGWRIPVLMYAAMGMAVLAKGPIGLVLPTAVIGMSLLIRRLPAQSGAIPSGWDNSILHLFRPFAPRHFLATCWSMRPILAIVMVVAVALPWYLWVHFRTEGAWTAGFFLKHNLERATRAMDGHNGGFLFYPLALIIGFFPWSIFWLPSVIDGVRSARKPSALSASSIFVLCWIGVYVALFSLAKTKLPSYITPCYPGLALLTGAFLARWRAGELVFSALWRRLAFGSLIVAGIGTAIVLPILCHYLLPGEEFLGIAGAIPALGGLIALVYAEKNRPVRSQQWMAGTSIALTLIAFAVISDRVDSHRHLEDLVSTVYGDLDASQVELSCLSSSEGSWVFYCRQPLKPIPTSEEAMQYLSESDPNGKQRVVITTARRLSLENSISPLANLVVRRIPYFMRPDEILVLKPAPEVTQQAGAPNPYEIR
jgi:4-amino-4-deoxy-L-arabinose transferase-like glycosyltransferase